MGSGRRTATPFGLVVVAVLATDVVFAVDSVPAGYGITGPPRAHRTDAADASREGDGG